MVLLQIQQQRDAVAALFEGWEETLIWSCLSGSMGEIYADDAAHPRCAAAIIGDFSFLAGDAGASSYTWYPGGIEIEIVTRQDVQRCGLGSACASQLILNCLDRGLYPSWDAANKTSLHLAESLGYAFSHEYAAYWLKKQA